MKIYEIINSEQKSKITLEILESLPEWFAECNAVEKYSQDVKTLHYYVIEENSHSVGFCCLKRINEYTSEIYVMGIKKEFHHSGIGTFSIMEISKKLLQDGYKILMVKTLGASANYEYYESTRKFYLKNGFIPLEEYHEIWGKENPCLIMVKPL